MTATVDDATIAFAHRLADASGAAIRPYFRQRIEIANKLENDFDPVTEADKGGERAIRAILDAERPGDAYIHHASLLLQVRRHARADQQPEHQQRERTGEAEPHLAALARTDVGCPHGGLRCYPAAKPRRAEAQRNGPVICMISKERQGRDAFRLFSAKLPLMIRYKKTIREGGPCGSCVCSRSFSR